MLNKQFASLHHNGGQDIFFIHIWAPRRSCCSVRVQRDGGVGVAQTGEGWGHRVVEDISKILVRGGLFNALMNEVVHGHV